jgi:hypothetical protein
MTTQFLLIATGVYITALAVVTYFSRAIRRRFLGALAGGLAVAVVGVGVETLAHRLGWWQYPSVQTSSGPLLMYPLIILAWTIYALIGWRVVRRFGWRGQAVFLAIVMLQGILRDYLEAGQVLKLIVLAPGIATVLVDAAYWVGLTALAQGIMRLVAGPAAADRLAHRRWERA